MFVCGRDGATKNIDGLCRPSKNLGPEKSSAWKVSASLVGPVKPGMSLSSCSVVHILGPSFTLKELVFT